MLQYRHAPIPLVALVVALTLLTMPFQSANADDPPRTISVSGRGTATAAPDMAMIQTGVVTQAKLAADAMQQNNEVTRRLMTELKNMQVADTDMQTAQFNVQPDYERGERGQRKPEIVGYRVTNQLRVRVRDLDKLGELLDGLIRAGSNQVSGISFDVDDKTAVLNRARKKAIVNARQKAKLYAATANVAVGQVLSIADQQMSIPQPRFYGRGEAAMASSVPVAKGEQEFVATVNMTFEIVGGQGQTTDNRQ